MSDGQEREHPASARRRTQFAERGQTVQSRDLIAAFILAMGTVIISAQGAKLAHSVIAMMRICLGELPTANSPTLFYLLGKTFLRAVLPVVAGSLLAAIVANFVIHRGVPPTRGLRFDLTRINPINKLASLFGLRQISMMLLTNGLKVLGLAALFYVTAARPLTAFVLETPASLGLALRDAGSLVEQVVFRSLLAVIIIGIADWLYNWYRLEQQMRMSTQELRDEAKDESSDPRLRGKRRRMAQKLLQSISVAEVERANVVLVNPTHVAVALMYNEGLPAPKLVAKGADAMAERIRTIARRANVPIVSQPPLARLLFAKVKVGQNIPEETWQAVAVVLAHVLRLKRGVR